MLCYIKIVWIVALISFSNKNIYAFYCIFIHNGIITIEMYVKTRETITK